MNVERETALWKIRCCFDLPQKSVTEIFFMIRHVRFLAVRIFDISQHNSDGRFYKGLLIIIIIIIMFSLLHLTSIIESRNGNWFFFGEGGEIRKLVFPLRTP
jgi:hypothetical protein